jgi:hypothetical protein
VPQRSSEQIRASIEEQRLLLAKDLEQLRSSITEVTDWRKQLRTHKSEAIAAAAVAGFVIAGGLSAFGRRRRRS